MRQLLFFLVLMALATLPGSVRAAGLARPPNNLGLSAYWSFDQGTSTKVVDQSGKGHTLTLTTSGSVLPTWVIGRFSKGLAFDGSTNYATIPTVSDLSFVDSTFTISYWIKESSATGTFVMANGAVGGGWGLRDDGAVFLKNISNSQNTYSMSAALLNDNKWHHVVYVITTSSTVVANNTISAYVDGASVAMIGTPTVTYSPNTNFSIGNRNSSSNPWAGSVDEVRIYGRGLSATEVQGLYRKGQVAIKNVSRSGLVGEWKFDEGTSTLAHNSVVNGSRASLVNGATWLTGKHGKAVQLDGNTQYVTIPYTPALSPSSVTTSFWFTLTSTIDCDASNNYRILFNRANGNTGWRVVLEQDKSTQFDVGISGTQSRSGGVNVDMQVGVPIYLTFTYDATTGDQKVWANGVLKSTKSNTPAPLDPNSNPLTLGAGGTVGTCPAGNGYTPGKYDDVRVYSRALSSDEIYSLYKERTVAVNTSRNGELADGLVGLWSFDGADMQGATAYDRSGSGNNGTLTNTPVRAIGKMGQALSYNGSNSYVSAGNASSLNFGAGQDFTIGFWVKTTASPGSTKPIAKANVDTTGSGWGFYQAGNSVYLKIADGTSSRYEQAVGPLNDGKWHHVLYSMSRTGNCNRYLDGSLVASTGCSAWSSVDLSNASNLTFGMNSPLNGYWSGALDDIRIYNRALSTAEAKQLYLMGK
ncbi:LamG domain-containing protein [Patescibacteria group bacterium]|nr:LamG domain-containing protein [Patescibacteria group bacterium]